MAFTALYVAQTRQFYATALVLVGVAVIVAFDLARSANRGDRVMALFVDGLLAEGAERPASGQTGVTHLSAAIDRALGRISRTRGERQAHIDYLQTLADTVAAALVVTDADGRIEWSNLAARREFGEAGARFSDIAGLDPAVAARLAALQPGERKIVAFPDGARLVSVSGFEAPGGGPRRLIALQRLSGELDAVELKAWQDLARILSHEMMNSLTPICSLAESSARLLREQPGGGAEVAEAVEVIARRSTGLMSFVDRYRRLAELPPPEKAPVGAAEFVARVDRLMGGLIEDRRVDYESRVDPADLSLNVDAELLEQAVINLIKNALDAVEGRPGAAVRLTCRSEAGEVLIEVEDNGPGLAEGDADCVFVPFFSRKPGGSGIGLSLARQIALAHSGRIEHLRRAPGGARFRMTLPA